MATPYFKTRLLPLVALAAALTACGNGNDGIGPIRVSAGDTYALTSGNRLISFNRASPGTARTAVAITGVTAGETLVGVDFRPSNGLLYGVGTAGTVYTIDTTSGVATSVFVITGATLSGGAFGVDFNPVPDALRVVSDTGQNLRVNMTTGVATIDTPLTGPGAAGISATAYTNSFSNACRTTIYYLDTTEGLLLTSASPNAGVTTSVGALGAAAANAVSAFEISSVSESSNTAYAVLTVGTAPTLYTVNLATGVATSVGAIGGAAVVGEQVRGLAMAPPATLPAVAAGELFGLTEGGRLVSFNRSAPGKLCSNNLIGPLANGESVIGIDFRPSTGALHALASASGTARLLTLDPATGAVTDDAPISVALTGTDYGMDFNPTGPVALRLVGDNGQNLRVTDIASGATTSDGALNGASTGATAAGYTNSVQGAGTTTLYVLDTAADTLNIQNPPNAGTVTMPLPLGLDFGPINGFDIDGRDNVALLAGNVGSAAVSSLYTVDLTTGTATVVAGGAIGSLSGITDRVRGLTRPTPTTTVFGLTEADELVQVSLADPMSVTSIGAVTGLVGEDLVGIDFRPSTGLLYGVGSGGGLFTINTSTALATRVVLSADQADMGADGTPAFTALAGMGFGMDFNPMPASVPLRIVSDAEQNLRVTNPVTGTTFTDTGLSRAPVALSAVAYSNSFTPNPASTVLYALDAASDRLMTISPPNNGTTRVVGPTLADVTATSTLEIAGPATALAVFDGVGTKTLYSLSLATGASAAVGAIATSDAIVALAAPISSTEPAAGSTVFAMGFDSGMSSYNLLSFARNAPGTLLTDVGVTGLAGGMGETVVGMDFRSLDGLLYVLTNTAGVGRVYTLNTVSGVAALIGTTLVADAADTGVDGTVAYTGLSGTAFGMDFNPLPASVPLRIISDTGQNLRVTSLTTLATFTDGNINQPAPDVHAAAYTNSVTPNPVSTMLFVIDAGSGALLQQNPPNNGTLLNIGALSATDSFSTVSGFDIAGGANGVSLAALQPIVGVTPQPQSRLYRINLTTGAATEVVSGALVGGAAGVPLRGLAIRIQ